MMRRGWPWVATSLTGTIATPIPWVNVTRWLTQPVALGFFERSSSRTDSITWRLSSPSL